MNTLIFNLPEVLLSLAGLITGFVVPYHIDQRMRERGPAMAPVTTLSGLPVGANTFAWDYAIALVKSWDLDKNHIVRVASIITDGIKDGKTLDHVSSDAMEYVRDKHFAKNTRVLDTAPGARSAPTSAYDVWVQWKEEEARKKEAAHQQAREKMNAYLMSRDDALAKIAWERAERLP